MKTIEVHKTIDYTEPIYDTIFKIKKPIEAIKIEGRLKRPILKNVVFELEDDNATALRIGGDGITQINAGHFEYDVYGGNGLDISFEKDWSNLSGCYFKGHFFYQQKAINIKTKNNQYINTSNFDFQVRVAETFAEVDKLSQLCSFKLLGQEYKNENKKAPFTIEMEKGIFDIYIDDLKREEKGILKGKTIRLGDMMTMQGFKHLNQYNVNLDDAEIVMNSLLVDTHSKQMVMGDKTIMNTLKIHSNKGKLLVFKGKEYIEL